MSTQTSKITRAAFALALLAMLAFAALLPSHAQASEQNTQQQTSYTLPFSQTLIDQVGKQSGSGSVACLGYSYAYAYTIVTNQVHYWYEWDSNGGASEASFFGKLDPDNFLTETYDSDQSIYRAMYDYVSTGHPCIVHVHTDDNTAWRSSEHWICVVGYTNVSDPNNLSSSNFLILDPTRTYDTNTPTNMYDTERFTYVPTIDGGANLRVAYGVVAHEHSYSRANVQISNIGTTTHNHVVTYTPTCWCGDTLATVTETQDCLLSEKSCSAFAETMAHAMGREGWLIAKSLPCMPTQENAAE